MKSTLFQPYIYILLLAASCGVPDGVHETGTDAGSSLQRKVKKERYDIYNFNGKDSICEEILETLFDTAGHITLETYFDGGYTRRAGKQFIYSTNGKLISTRFLENFTYLETDTLIYDASGVISRQIKEINNNYIPLTRLTTWFKNNKPSLKMEEDLLQKKTTWKDTFQWNSDQSKLEKTGFSGDGKVAFYSSSVYNKKGEEVEYKRYDPGRILISETRHLYDSSGKLTEYQEIPVDKAAYIESYFYDTKEKKTRMECYEGGAKPGRVYLYFYNGNDDRSLIIRMDEEEKIDRKTYYRYEYY